MKRKYFFFSVMLAACFLQAAAQSGAPLYTPYTTANERAKLYERLTHQAILQTLSEPPADSSEDQWEGAFDAMELIGYKTPYVRTRLFAAFDSVQSRTLSFQRALLEAAYTNFPGAFRPQVQDLLHYTTDPKIFAMCAEYLMRQNKDQALAGSIKREMKEKFKDSCQTNPILFMLSGRLSGPRVSGETLTEKRLLKEVLSVQFLAHQIVLYSFQRQDRDYPGLALVRKADGTFITDSTGGIFSVPQLARSITNLPGYLTNGNTPQGIFRMVGFGVSTSNFIGPTPNVQMGMPVELNVGTFLGDSTTTDTAWTKERYGSLLPENLRGYLPFYESYYAGLAGRTEIIAHGSTIDPSFYRGKPYYPLTPTDGCLCTKELWNGIRLQSDQQLLVNALLRAGGAEGYCVVLKIGNRKAPVTLQELLPYLSK